MKISVTKEHINNGQTCKSVHCPIALAIKEHFDTFVSVGPCEVAIGGPFNNIPLPQIARRFIEDFDYGDSVEPFTFELESRTIWP